MSHTGSQDRELQYKARQIKRLIVIVRRDLLHFNWRTPQGRNAKYRMLLCSQEVPPRNSSAEVVKIICWSIIKYLNGLKQCVHWTKKNEIMFHFKDYVL